MHQSSYDLMGYLSNKYLDPDKELLILDMGSLDVNGNYRNLFQKPKWRYTGCDICPGKNVDVVMTHPHEIPLTNESFDVVISGSTLEHVDFFWVWMQEVARVLKPGGFVIMIAPGKGPIHPTPLDCWRFLPQGMDAIIKWLNFKRLETWMDENSEWWDCILVAQKP